MFKINLTPAMESLDFKASSLDEAFIKAKANMIKPRPAKTQYIRVQGTNSSDIDFYEFALYPRYRGGELTSEEISKCMDGAHSEWSRAKTLIVQKVARVSKLSAIMKAKRQTAKDLEDGCRLTRIVISADLKTHVPVVAYVFQWTDSILVNCIAGINLCPYGKFDSSISKFDLGDIHEYIHG